MCFLNEEEVRLGKKQHYFAKYLTCTYRKVIVVQYFRIEWEVAIVHYCNFVMKIFYGFLIEVEMQEKYTGVHHSFAFE
jgi:hypothetical protein